MFLHHSWILLFYMWLFTYSKFTGLAVKSKPLTEGWNALKVTYSDIGQGYYDLPWSVEEATAEGKWQKIAQDSKLNVDVYSQPQDPRFLLLFDKKRTIAGIRLAFLEYDIVKEPNSTLSLEIYDMISQYKKYSYFGKTLWYATVLFIDDDHLVWFDGRRTPNKTTDDVVDGILYVDEDTDWEVLPRDECLLARRLYDSIEGRCADGVGKHYFLNGDDVHGCRHLLPVFATYNDGRLVGFGVGGYGTPRSTEAARPHTISYYDRGTTNLTNWMSDVPNCVKYNVEKYGFTTMHVFLQKNASNIKCPKEDWSISHCFAPHHSLPFLEPFSSG